MSQIYAGEGDPLRELAKALEAGERCVLATIVEARGSTPQKVGARLLLRADGAMVGTLGGGCIEAEAVEHAAQAISSGAPELLDFTLNEDIAVDYGLACGGTELILIDPTYSPQRDLELARRMAKAAESATRGAVMMLLDSADGVASAAKLAWWRDGTVVGDLGPLQAEALRVARRVIGAPRPQPAIVTLGENTRAFLDVFAEPPEVVVVGGGHVGRAIAGVANLMGYRISVIDDREEFANSDRFPEADRVIAGDIGDAVRAYPATPNSAIVIVTRGHKYDYQALAAAAATNAGYVGLMGSRRKVTLILRQLLADGVPEERLRSIHAPIGLDIGAVSPEEIALSIMSEIAMDRSGGTGAPLGDVASTLEAARRRRTR
jgi:xanthine dehydrogenase accessory factor